MKYVKYILLIIVILMDGYLVYHSTLKGSTSSSFSEATTDTVVDIVDKINPSDESITTKFDFSKIHSFVRKLFGHFGAFMVCAFICFVMMVLFTKNNYLRFGITLLNGVAFAIITEVIQLHVEGRYGSIKDVMIDISGCLVAMAISLMIMVIIYFVKKGKNKYEKEYI